MLFPGCFEEVFAARAFRELDTLGILKSLHSRFLLRHTQPTPQVFITSSHVYFRNMRVFTCSVRCFCVGATEAGTCQCNNACLFSEYAGFHLLGAVFFVLVLRRPAPVSATTCGLGICLLWLSALVLCLCSGAWGGVSVPQLQPKFFSSASRNRTLPRHVLVGISVTSCVSFCDYDHPSRE